LKKREQNCQRKDFVTGLDGLIVLKRERWLRGERTEPFAVVVDEAPKRPLRKFECEQCKGCIGPGAGLGQAIDFGFCGKSECAKANAHTRHHVGYQFGVEGVSLTKLLFQSGKTIIVLRIEQHDTSQLAAACCGYFRKMVKTSYESETEEAPVVLGFHKV
jgi:hypothetical protein